MKKFIAVLLILIFLINFISVSADSKLLKFVNKISLDTANFYSNGIYFANDMNYILSIDGKWNKERSFDYTDEKFINYYNIKTGKLEKSYSLGNVRSSEITISESKKLLAIIRTTENAFSYVELYKLPEFKLINKIGYDEQKAEYYKNIGKVDSVYWDKSHGIVKISPDDRYLVYSSLDNDDEFDANYNDFKIWDTNNGKFIAVNKVTPNERYNLPKGSFVPIQNTARIEDFKFSQDGKKLLCLYTINATYESEGVISDGTQFKLRFLKLIDTETNKIVELDTKTYDSLFGEETLNWFYPEKYDVDFNIKSNILTIATTNEVRFFIYNLTDGKRMFVCQSPLITGRRARIISVNIINDGKSIITANGDNSLRLWDVKTGKISNTYYDKVNYYDLYTTPKDNIVIVQHDGYYIDNNNDYISKYDYNYKILDYQNKKTLDIWSAKDKSTQRIIQITPNIQYVITAPYKSNGNIYVWRLAKF